MSIEVYQYLSVIKTNRIVIDKRVDKSLSVTKTYRSLLIIETDTNLYLI